jgi:hypothetical protein
MSFKQTIQAYNDTNGQHSFITDALANGDLEALENVVAEYIDNQGSRDGGAILGQVAFHIVEACNCYGESFETDQVLPGDVDLDEPVYGRAG